MSLLAQRYAKVLARIQAALNHAGSTHAVQLLAVSKQQSADAIRALHRLGQIDFAENYLQEALNKQQLLLDLPLRWHFIGNLQSNKTRLVAEHFACVHSVDRLTIAERLSSQRPAALGPLQVFMQVNIDGEQSKAGCHVDEVAQLVAQVSRLPNLQLCGLMAIPQQNSPHAFARLQALQAQVRDVHANPQLWQSTSMGMSADMEDAIAAGATHVRVGTALFGQRVV